MSTTKITLGTLLNELAEALLIAPVAERPLPAAIAPADDTESSPWYVKTMVGVAAWIAAFFLGGFLGMLGIIDTTAQMVGWGIGLTVVAIGLKWWRRQAIFWGQLAFAMVLAGQALLLLGIGDLSQDGTVMALALIGLEVVLLLLYPDALHRMLSILAIIAALSFLIYDYEMPDLLHLLFFATAAGVVGSWQGEFRLLTSRGHAYRAPLGYGLVLALFGLALLALGSWYGITAWWISAAALALVLLYLIQQILRDLQEPFWGRVGLWAVGALLLLCIPAYETPGILAAVIVLLVGRWRGNSLLLGLATLFLLFFLGAYYYNLEITLLNKSYILMGVGAALLAAWWGVRRLEKGLTEADGGGA